jgi:hypothetical protein
MVVLDESRYERETGDRFTWNLVPRFRVLSLGTGDSEVYTSQVERDGAFQDEAVPAIRGATLEEIPFVFVNSTDLGTQPGEVPLINLANLSMAIYRGEADHRSALFMSGQDTLVITGYDISAGESENPTDDNSPIIGSGAYLNLPDENADAKFIGPDSNALSEQRTSLEDDYTRAGEEGIKLLSSGAGAEAAETLRIRVAARTATLQTIAMTAAQGLETALRKAAEWVGANPDDVKVEPNLDFVEEAQNVKELIDFATAKKAGTPLSWKSVHNYLRAKDFTEMTFEEELDAISEENDDERLSGTDDELAGMSDADIMSDPAMAARAAAGEFGPRAQRRLAAGEAAAQEDEDGDQDDEA